MLFCCILLLWSSDVSLTCYKCVVLYLLWLRYTSYSWRSPQKTLCFIFQISTWEMIRHHVYIICFCSSLKFLSTNLPTVNSWHLNIFQSLSSKWMPKSYFPRTKFHFIVKERNLLVQAFVQFKQRPFVKHCILRSR